MTRTLTHTDRQTADDYVPSDGLFIVESNRPSIILQDGQRGYSLPQVLKMKAISRSTLFRWLGANRIAQPQFLFGAMVFTESQLASFPKSRIRA